MVCPNDAHYLRREDADMQDVLLCIQTGKTVDEENRMKFQTEEFYLKSEEQMRELFPTGMKVGSSAWRGNIRELKLRMQKFFRLYGDYTDEQILMFYTKKLNHI